MTGINLIDVIRQTTPVTKFVLAVLLIFTGAVLLFGDHDAALIANWEAQLQQQTLSAGREARQYIVVYTNGVFSPTNLRIRQGDSVTFRNESTATLSIGEFSSSDVPSRGVFIHVFSAAGVYSYTNFYHHEERGTITVQP